MIVSLTALLILLPQSEASPQASRTDSAAILRSMRNEQEKFERIHRDDLPVAYGGGFDHCDEIRGFHCFVYGDPEEVWKPPEDTKRVIAARDTLLARLERAALSLPSDPWIAGQRVRYLVDARRKAEARDVAESCQPAEDWWCLALRGYAAHAAGEYGEAEATYSEALEAMTREQRCEWSDITLLLPDAPARLYQDLDCEARAPVEKRFWWLADPLYLIPGNERLSEHYSRQVAIRFEEDAPSISTRSWQPASSMWLLRYGVPGWEQEERGFSLAVSEPRLHARYRGPSEVFEPAWSHLERPETWEPGVHPLRPARAKTGYAPAYAERFDTLRYQTAVFRRGDSAVVLAAYDLSRDSVDPGTPTLGGLFLAKEGGVPRMARKNGSASDVLTITAPPQPWLLSIEAVTNDGRQAGRTRFWLPLAPTRPAEIALSDILLLSRADATPRSLEEAVPLARRGTSVRYGETVGLYWEIYGLGPGSVPLSLRLTLVKGGSSFAGRAARALGLGKKDSPKVSLKWEEMSQPVGPTTGTIALDVAKNDPGRYTLRLEVTSKGRGTGAQRQITITNTSEW